jgi:hypothetical protein
MKLVEIRIKVTISEEEYQFEERAALAKNVSLEDYFKKDFNESMDGRGEVVEVKITDI